MCWVGKCLPLISAPFHWGGGWLINASGLGNIAGADVALSRARKFFPTLRACLTPVMPLFLQTLGVRHLVMLENFFPSVILPEFQTQMTDRAEGLNLQHWQSPVW